MKLLAGTRGSNLALAQTTWVISLLKEHGIDGDKKIIKTKGDKILDKALDKIGDKGLFVKEIEAELIDSTIDFAVHSYKDMPTSQPENLLILDIPKRANRNDVLILNPKYKSLEELKEGDIIGTGSKRRIHQINQIKSGLKMYPVRGNIETRIKKIQDEDLAGIVLAKAALERLNLNHYISYEFSEEEILPAPAQGAIAIQVRKDRTDLIEIFKKIINHNDNDEVKAERYFMKLMEGGCHSPIGASCHIEGDQINFTGLFGKEDGSRVSLKSISGARKDWENIVEAVSNSIKKELL